jgi:hypothetical protein
VGEKGQNELLGREQWILHRRRRGSEGGENKDGKMVMVKLIV